MAYNRTLRKEASRYFLSFEFVVYLQMKKQGEASKETSPQLVLRAMSKSFRQNIYDR